MNTVLVATQLLENIPAHVYGYCSAARQHHKCVIELWWTATSRSVDRVPSDKKANEKRGVVVLAGR